MKERHLWVRPIESSETTVKTGVFPTSRRQFHELDQRPFPFSRSGKHQQLLTCTMQTLSVESALVGYLGSRGGKLTGILWAVANIWEQHIPYEDIVTYLALPTGALSGDLFK